MGRSEWSPVTLGGMYNWQSVSTPNFMPWKHQHRDDQTATHAHFKAAASADKMRCILLKCPHAVVTKQHMYSRLHRTPANCSWCRPALTKALFSLQMDAPLRLRRVTRCPDSVAQP
jgi:hypothetical protein